MKIKNIVVGFVAIAVLIVAIWLCSAIYTGIHPPKYVWHFSNIETSGPIASIGSPYTLSLYSQIMPNMTVHQVREILHNQGTPCCVEMDRNTNNLCLVWNNPDGSSEIVVIFENNKASMKSAFHLRP